MSSYVTTRSHLWSKTDEEEDDTSLADTRFTLKMYKQRNYHSTTYRDMISLCFNEKGKWRWPVNGADLVYPGIYLGDETTALCTG